MTCLTENPSPEAFSWLLTGKCILDSFQELKTKSNVYSIKTIFANFLSLTTFCHFQPSALLYQDKWPLDGNVRVHWIGCIAGTDTKLFATDFFWNCKLQSQCKLNLMPFNQLQLVDFVIRRLMQQKESVLNIKPLNKQMSTIMEVSDLW